MIPQRRFSRREPALFRIDNHRIFAGVAAVAIRPFMQPGAFDPEAIAAMSEALEAALKEFQDAGQRDVLCEAIAGRILAAAKLGERDPVRLRAAALAGLPGRKD